MLSGLLLINKPKDITSFDCIRHIQHIVRTPMKISHMGTLDPFATGLIIIGFDRSVTKKSNDFLTLDKEYIVKAKLGELSDTLDYTGNVHSCEVSDIAHDDIMQAIRSMGSSYIQTPPIYSALKHQGKPLHELIRSQKLSEEALHKIVHYKSREVFLHTLSLIECDRHWFTIKAHVSHGTYVRCLMDDIAKKLNTRATTYELERTRIGVYSVDQSFQLYDIKTVQDIKDRLIAA